MQVLPVLHHGQVPPQPITLLLPFAINPAVDLNLTILVFLNRTIFSFNNLTYSISAPAISSIFPTHLPSQGENVEISGEHFGNDASAIQIYMVDAEDRITYWNNVTIVIPNSLLSCTVPPGAGTQFRLIVEIVGQAAITSPFFSYEGLFIYIHIKLFVFLTYIIFYLQPQLSHQLSHTLFLSTSPSLFAELILELMHLIFIPTPTQTHQILILAPM